MITEYKFIEIGSDEGFLDWLIKTFNNYKGVKN